MTMSCKASAAREVIGMCRCFYIKENDPAFVPILDGAEKSSLFPRFQKTYAPDAAEGSNQGLDQSACERSVGFALCTNCNARRAGIKANLPVSNISGFRQSKLVSVDLSA